MAGGMKAVPGQRRLLGALLLLLLPLPLGGAGARRGVIRGLHGQRATSPRGSGWRRRPGHVQRSGPEGPRVGLGGPRVGLRGLRCGAEGSGTAVGRRSASRVRARPAPPRVHGGGVPREESTPRRAVGDGMGVSHSRCVAESSSSALCCEDVKEKVTALQEGSACCCAASHHFCYTNVHSPCWRDIWTRMQVGGGAGEGRFWGATGLSPP